MKLEKEEGKSAQSGRPPDKAKRGEPLPGDWTPSAVDVEYGLELGLTESDVNHFAEDMKLWAKANSNRPVGRKADWTATFHGWLRREAGKRRGGPGGGGGPRGPGGGPPRKTFAQAGFGFGGGDGKH